jgi:hypothetical protein
VATACLFARASPRSGVEGNTLGSRLTFGHERGCTDDAPDGLLACRRVCVATACCFARASPRSGVEGNTSGSRLTFGHERGCTNDVPDGLLAIRRVCVAMARCFARASPRSGVERSKAELRLAFGDERDCTGGLLDFCRLACRSGTACASFAALWRGGERQEIAARFPSSQGIGEPCACKRKSLRRLAACGSKPLLRPASRGFGPAAC